MLANILLLRSWSICWSPSFYFGLFGEGVCWLILGGSIELGVGQLLYANFSLYMAPFIYSDWLAKDFCWPLWSGSSKGVLANIHVLRFRSRRIKRVLANILLLRSWSISWSPSFYFGLFGEGVCWLILGGSIELGVGQLLYANFILYMLAPCILFLIGWPRTFVGHSGVEVRKGCWRTFMC